MSTYLFFLTVNVAFVGTKYILSNQNNEPSHINVQRHADELCCLSSPRKAVLKKEKKKRRQAPFFFFNFRNYVI